MKIAKKHVEFLFLSGVTFLDRRWSASFRFCFGIAIEAVRFQVAEVQFELTRANRGWPNKCNNRRYWYNRLGTFHISIRVDQQICTQYSQ